ncbi:hypothetical protein, partial [Pectobacterium versatile]|uniref:hypothetical protein n=1 Tax=Pectobacterium versatile TaxID=2488639 RepID=UPI001B390658
RETGNLKKCVELKAVYLQFDVHLRKAEQLIESGAYFLGSSKRLTLLNLGEYIQQIGTTNVVNR